MNFFTGLQAKLRAKQDAVRAAKLSRSRADAERAAKIIEDEHELAKNQALIRQAKEATNARKFGRIAGLAKKVQSNLAKNANNQRAGGLFANKSEPTRNIFSQPGASSGYNPYNFSSKGKKPRNPFV